MRILIVFTFLLGFISNINAGDITVTQNGITYSCTAVGGGNNNHSCWQKCPWTFDSCVQSCGGGNECMQKCPWTFDTCAKTCNAR